MVVHNCNLTTLESRGKKILKFTVIFSYRAHSWAPSDPLSIEKKGTNIKTPQQWNIPILGSVQVWSFFICLRCGYWSAVVVVFYCFWMVEKPNQWYSQNWRYISTKENRSMWFYGLNSVSCFWNWSILYWPFSEYSIKSVYECLACMSLLPIILLFSVNLTKKSLKSVSWGISQTGWCLPLRSSLMVNNTFFFFSLEWILS